MKPHHLTALVTIMLATAPLHSAKAWSHTSDSDVSTAAGTSRFTDPDDALEGLTGGAGDSSNAGSSTLNIGGTNAAPVTPFVCVGSAGGCTCPNCQGNK